MRKLRRLLGFVVKICAWVVLLLLVLFVVEQIFPPQPDMPDPELVRAGDSVMFYQVETRDDHVSFMDTYTTDVGDMAYIDRGQRDGEVILLLHGTPTNSWLWRKMIPGLIDKGFRVIAPDMIGFGASDKAVNLDVLSPRLQAQRVVNLLDSLDIQEYSIVAHDQGGTWMWEIMHTYPESIRTVTILNTIGVYQGFHPPFFYGKPNLLTKGLSFFMGSRSLGTLMAYTALTNGVQHRSMMTAKAINGYVRPLKSGGDRTYYQFISSFDVLEERLSTLQETWPDFPAPVQIIRGIHDPILVADEQVPLLQQSFDIPDERIHLVDAKHFLPEEIPELLVEHIWEMMGNIE